MVNFLDGRFSTEHVRNLNPVRVADPHSAPTLSAADLGDGPLRNIHNIPVVKGSDVQDLAGDRFVVASPRDGKVVAVSSNGNVLWKTEIAGACGVSLLPNGHILVGANKRVVELDDEEKVVWEMKTEGYVRHVHGW